MRWDLSSEHNCTSTHTHTHTHTQTFLPNKKEGREISYHSYDKDTGNDSDIWLKGENAISMMRRGFKKIYWPIMVLLHCPRNRPLWSSGLSEDILTLRHSGYKPHSTKRFPVKPFFYYDFSVAPVMSRLVLIVAGVSVDVCFIYTSKKTRHPFSSTKLCLESRFITVKGKRKNVPNVGMQMATWEGGVGRSKFSWGFPLPQSVIGL